MNEKRGRYGNDVRARAAALRDSDMTLDEIADKLCEETGVRLAKSTLFGWLKGRPLSPTKRYERRVAGAVASRARRTRGLVELANAPPAPRPFSTEQAVENLRRSSIGIAIDWFLARGHCVSIPIEHAAPYDLVVECDEGMKRVQIKTTSHRDSRGNWIVATHRMIYDPTASAVTGHRRRRGYKENEVDWFFVVTAERTLFLLPIGLVAGKTAITLGHRYAGHRL
jgi:hypothetical protein